MSPFLRSLLALAPMLAAADAMPNPFCDGLTIGSDSSTDTEDFKLTAVGDEVTTIPDKCTRIGRKLIGEFLTVCNTPYSRPRLTKLMGVQYPLRAVYIACPKDVPGCSNLELSVTQYCGPVVPPQPARGGLFV